MKSSATLGVCLIATLFASLAYAQQTTSPNAYVYVITNPAANSYEIDGYKADSTGALTPLAGSPFWKTNKTLYAMAHTTNWFFVSDGTNIYTFSIASTGALKQVSSVDAAKYYEFSGLTGGALTLDHSGSTLYSLALDGSGDNEFQFFAKNSNNGSLSFFGSTSTNIAYGDLIFTGNNLYAYGFSCFQDTTFFYALKRSADGTLTRFNSTEPIPSYPNGDFCPVRGAADPANHLAVAMYLETNTSGPPAPPAWLAVYSVDNSGNLSTNSTSKNMVTSAVGDIRNSVASPAGNLLALAGTSGLQIFHFNGANPITAYTGLLAIHNISQILWDNHDHLYGISPAGLLYVFKITATGHKQAAGSPYSVHNPRAITVLSK
jgi:hypothetical protein